MELIDTQKRADEVLESLLLSKENRSFYLDFEADNFYHYSEVLCTVQMCVNGKFFLLDAINVDLKKHFSEIVKRHTLWLHGSDYDIYLLNRYLGVVPTKLHDTQIAARLCGFKRFGYAPLVEQIVGELIPKDSQRSDWTKRPLTDKMVDYAMNDVRYLPHISDLLMRRLEKLGRLDWFRESCSALVRNITKGDAVSKDVWRISGSGSFNSNELRFLKAIYDWRDDAAKVADRPSFKIINNQHLLTWAQDLAHNNEIQFPKNMRPARKEALIKAVEVAKGVPEELWPAKQPRPRNLRKRIDEDALEALISKRETVAKELKIEGSLLGSRKTLEAIIKDPKEAENLLKWQRELLEL